MRLLVIGASGFIGRHILTLAKHRGHEALGTASSSLHDDLVKFDLASDRILSAIGRDFFRGEGETIVVLAAMVTTMDRCLTEPEYTRQINVTNSAQLADDVSSLGAKLVFLSTGHVFDGLTGNYRETDTANPVNAYAAHKFEMEIHLRSRIPSSLIARLDKVVGDNPHEHHLLSEWWHLLEQRAPIVCAEGMEVSPTDVDDVAGAILTACEHNLCGVYHLAGPNRLLRETLARNFCRAAGRPETVLTKKLSEFGFADKRALRSSLSAEKFCGETGFRFQSADAIIASFLGNVGSVLPRNN